MFYNYKHCLFFQYSVFTTYITDGKEMILSSQSMLDQLVKWQPVSHNVNVMLVIKDFCVLLVKIQFINYVFETLI